MFELQNAQQKRIVGLGISALVFAFYAIFQLFTQIANADSYYDVIGDKGIVFQLGCTILMTLTVTYILMRSLFDHRELKHRQLHDSKTNLPNKFSFAEHLKMTFDTEEEANFSVLCVDIDRLKSVNESMGHAAGDQLIVKVSQRLQSILQTNQQLFKMEGGQFCIFADGIVDPDWLISISDHVFEAMGNSVSLADGDLYIDVTIGACVVDEKALKSEEILRRTEFALLQAKKKGGNCIVIYDEGISENAKEQSTLENHFRDLLENEKLELVFQPLINSNVGRIGGVEALARWNYSDQGYVSPMVFIPMAKRLGLVNKLGVQVLNRACLAAVGLGDLKMAVNISPEHFLADEFIDDVNNSLNSSGLSPSRLELEITEDVLLGDSDKVIEKIKNLREMGISIALDDFGTGYSGLSYIHKFEVDRLKIDAAFIRELETSASSRSVVSTIVQLAKIHNFSITAEGVETKGQYEFLSQFHGLWYQGYLFAKPLSLVELLQSDYITDSKKIALPKVAVAKVGLEAAA